MHMAGMHRIPLHIVRRWPVSGDPDGWDLLVVERWLSQCDSIHDVAVHWQQHASMLCVATCSRGLVSFIHCYTCSSRFHSFIHCYTCSSRFESAARRLSTWMLNIRAEDTACTCQTASIQGCLPDRLFSAFKPIPRDDDDMEEGEGDDPFEPSELPSGATQEDGQPADMS